MAKSRRQFLNRASLALMASASACRRAAQTSAVPPPGAPPAFGTAPPVGPAVSPETFAEAEKLVQVGLSPAARQMAAGNWRRQMAPVYERRMGPRKLALEPSIAPASRWDPILPGQPGPQPPTGDRFLRTDRKSTRLNSSHLVISYAVFC